MRCAACAMRVCFLRASQVIRPKTTCTVVIPSGTDEISRKSLRGLDETLASAIAVKWR